MEVPSPYGFPSLDGEDPGTKLMAEQALWQAWKKILLSLWEVTFEEEEVEPVVVARCQDEEEDAGPISERPCQVLAVDSIPRKSERASLDEMSAA
ncbi:MAG TPA: hypothetical protein VF173_13930 [Thermoanaerobaculia bacterium]|nr:hypothetical protein [Thermoanaerobaculia bacterium]